MRILDLLAAGALALAQDEKAENDAGFHALLLEAAGAYETYDRADNGARLAPTSCMGPRPLPVRLSASKDEGTHGRKLYFLYVLDQAAYDKGWKRPKQGKPPSFERKPAEQVLVKQAWTCVPADLSKGPRPDPLSLVQVEGKTFKTGEKKELFLMVRIDPAVEGTDRGWVYGTTTPDGKTVTSSGRIRSCMACHEKAGDGRLFGPPAARPEK